MITINLNLVKKCLKALAIATLTYLIFSLNSNQIVMHRTAPFQYPSPDTLVTDH